MSDVKDDTKGGPQSNGAHNGGSNGVAQDIFRQASALGGFLIVSFIAPIGGSSQSSAMERALSVAGEGAKQKVRDMAAKASGNLPAQTGKPGARQKPPVAPMVTSVNVVPEVSHVPEEV